MIKDFWDKRYATQTFAYGKPPNVFFESALRKLPPGKLLCPGEGEGRNAVFAAKNGWQVTAFDLSIEGKRKALQLAADNNVSIRYDCVGFSDFQTPAEQFDALALIYTHMPAELRTAFHRKMLQALKKGGTVMLEGFSKDQFGKASGGPKNIEMLFSKAELASDFQALEHVQITEHDIVLDEGPYHQGAASIVRLVGRK